MTRRRMTDGERISLASWKRQHGDQDDAWSVYLAESVDRLIRKRMAEAWGDGWFAAKWDKKHVDENPYRGRAKK